MWPGVISQIYAALSGLLSTSNAQTWTPITPSDTVAFAAASPAIAFRALRFDVAGTVKFDASGGTGITRNVAAGEVWAASSAAVLRIYATGTSASGIDGLG